MIYWITDEDVLEQYPELCICPYTELDMCIIYDNMVDKEEYPDFRCWLADMVKSGIFKEE